MEKNTDTAHFQAWLTEPTDSSPDEATWHRRWMRVGAAAESPAELAVRGGAAADRAAWIFMSGYQAALRSVFPEAGSDDWSCFAVSEPKEEPACVLEGSGPDLRLSGEKSWIAGVRHIRRLVVSLDGLRRFAIVGRDAPGVTLTDPRRAGFLPELSQGSAKFEGVPVQPGEMIDDPLRAKSFRIAEPAFVLLALNAHLVARSTGHPSVSEGGTAALEAGLGVVNDLVDGVVVPAGGADLDALRTRTQAAVSAFETLVLPSLAASALKTWQRDRRLLRMFGAAVS